MSFYTSNKEKVPKELNYQMNQVLDEIMIESKKLNLDHFDDNQSLGDFVFERFEKRVEEKYPDRFNDPEFKKMVYGLLDWRYLAFF